jgi:hypothetical protein
VLLGIPASYDEVMRLQFGTSGLILILTFIGISLGSFLSVWHRLNDAQQEWLPFELAYVAPIWLPLVFAAYAAGRRVITVKFVLAFAMVQLLAYGVVLMLPDMWQWWFGQ